MTIIASFVKTPNIMVLKAEYTFGKNIVEGFTALFLKAEYAFGKKCFEAIHRFLFYYVANKPLSNKDTQISSFLMSPYEST